MKLNTLRLQDKRLFLKFLSLKRHYLAVYSFEDIYIWKKLFSIRWAIIEKSLCVFFQDNIGCFLYLPPLSEEGSPRAVVESFRIMDSFNRNKQVSRIENLEKEDLPFFKKLGFICQEKPGDYLYLNKDMSWLRGNRFKSKRAALNYFTSHYDARVLPFSAGDTHSCLALYAEWMRGRAKKNSDHVYQGMMEDSRKVLGLLLKSCSALGVEGLVVKVGGNVKGFTFGYALNNETFCVLYEITDLSVNGLAQFIFREFCRSAASYKYINSMDDSGLENLRRVKLSYHPVKLIDAYIAARKDA